MPGEKQLPTARTILTLCVVVLSLVVPASAEALTVSRPLANAAFSDQITISGTAASTESRTINASLNGIKVGTAQAATDGRFELRIPVAQMAAGKYLLAVTAGTAGSAGSPTVSRYVFVDHAGPVITTTNPAANGYSNGGPVTGSMSDVAGVARATMRVTAAAGTATTLTLAVDAYGRFASADIGTFGLENGRREITVFAWDKVGNMSERTIVFTYDTQAPVVAISAPASGGTIGAAITSVGTATDNTGVAAITVTLGTTKLTASYRSGSWTTGQVSTRQMIAGPTYLTVRAIDNARNVTVSRIPVVIENVAPTMTFAAPTSSPTATGSLAFDLCANDASGIASVHVTLDSPAAARTMLAAAGGCRFTGKLSVVGAVAGLHRAYVTATDRNGNTRTAVIGFTVV